ncbi:hypothetical protein D3C73_1021620 [compost metagenome]
MQQFATGTVRVRQLVALNQFAHDLQGFLLIHPFSPTVESINKIAGFRRQFKLAQATKQALGQKISKAIYKPSACLVVSTHVRWR